MADRSNKIRPEARIVALLLQAPLLLAFYILYFHQDRSGEAFSWEINPPIMAAFMGAGYVGGAYFFLRVALERRWHRVATGFLPVTVFATLMLIATILHWERFDLGHLPFQIWLFLYVIAPLLVPFLWWRNRGADPGTPEPVDLAVPPWLRLLTGGFGVAFLAFAVTCFVQPRVVAEAWAWPTTPLLARILGGWSALMGVGGVVLCLERRWSGWRIQIESMFVWHLLVVVACFLHLRDFHTPFNFFIVGEVLGLAGFALIYASMTSRAHAAASA